MKKHIDQPSIDSKLFSVISEGDLDPLCDYFYERFAYPVSILDTNMRTLSSSPRGQLMDDPYWDSAQTNHGISAQLLESTKKYSYIEAMLNTTGIICVDWGDVKYPNLNGVLSLNRGVFGYTSLIYRDAHYDLEQAMQIAALFNKCVLTVLQNTSRSVPAGHYFLRKVFATQLLQGHLSTNEDLLYWEKLSDFHMEPQYAILHLRASQNEINTIDREISQWKIGHLPPEYLNNNEYMLLLYGIKKAQHLAELIDSIRLNIPIGCSGLFDDLLDITEHASQARFACQCAIYDNTILLYDEDLQSRRIVFQIMCDVDHAENYTHPIFIKLKQYDQEYNTSYFSTLLLFLKNYCNAVTAAAEMNVHRNTLNYRLRKINDICNCNLDDKRLLSELVFCAMLIK